MPFDIDAEIGLSAQALKVHSRRLELIATNLANVDTPNYKARDIDFRSVLSKMTDIPSSPQLNTTQPMHMAAPDPVADADVKYRTPLAPSLDGNTVDSQLEHAAFAESSVHYQASLSFVSGAFRDLMLAITGQG